MRVILTSNVPKLGEVGDVCDVAPGYGRNYLIPQGLAMLATEGTLKQIDDLKRTERRRQDRVRYDMERLAGRIGALHLSFTAHVGETGRLYGSITASDIAEAIEEEIDEPIDRRKIMLDESIRTLGEHEVSIHLMPGVDAACSVAVVPSEEIVEDIGLMADEEAIDSAEAESEGEPAAAAPSPDELPVDAPQADASDDASDEEPGDGLEGTPPPNDALAEQSDTA